MMASGLARLCIREQRAPALVLALGLLCACGVPGGTPQALLSSSAQGGIVTAKATFTLTSPSPDILAVEFGLDDRRLSTVRQAPFSFEADSTQWEDGPHALTAVVAFLDRTILETSLTIAVDNQPPRVEIRAPDDGSTVVLATDQKEVVFSADITEPSGEPAVQFTLDGRPFASFVSGPHSHKIPISALSSLGSAHTFEVRATSPSGQATVKRASFGIAAGL